MSIHKFSQAWRRWALALSLMVVLAVLVLPVQSRTTRQSDAAPNALVALPLSVQEVALSWSAADDAFSYTVRRNGALLATLYGQAHSYADTRVEPSGLYTYTVSVLYANLVESPPSLPAMVRVPALPDTPDTTPPSPPTELVGVARDDAVLLDWQDANDDSDITAYQIRRDGLLLASVNSGTLSYSDTTVLSSTTYIYSVEALDVMGHHSPLSNLVTVTTLGNAYPHP